MCGGVRLRMVGRAPLPLRCLRRLSLSAVDKVQHDVRVHALVPRATRDLSYGLVPRNRPLAAADDRGDPTEGQPVQFLVVEFVELRLHPDTGGAYEPRRRPTGSPQRIPVNPLTTAAANSSSRPDSSAARSALSGAGPARTP
jgi:hypothetical protein